MNVTSAANSQSQHRASYSLLARDPARFKTLLLKVKRLKNMRNLNTFPLKYLSMKDDK